MKTNDRLHIYSNIGKANRHDPRVRQLATDVLSYLPYDPNDDQMLVVVALAHYLLYAPEQSVFILGGYAGTGKTSLTGAIVKGLNQQGIKSVLMAPTGRAAHIFSDYSGHPCYTIHRKIYRQQGYGIDSFNLAENKHTNTVFIVDEASMISNANDGSIFGSGRLLEDLISYVYNGMGCKLVLMGDNAQLPPVGQAVSPALDNEVLQSMGLTTYGVFLQQIARQAEESGILHNATLMRQAMEDGTLGRPRFELEGMEDITTVSSEFLLETISDCYDRDGSGETIIITRSNKRATQFNMGIRNSILYREDLLVNGDMLLVAKNNYYWAKDYDELDFIANGDVCVVKRVWGDIERQYGLRFANVTVEFPDHDGLEMDCKIVVDCLLSDTPALDREQSERLFNEVWEELTGDKRERYKALKEHPYFNALQVKYAYAMTCHKAQGGQWRNVFIDMGGIMPDAMQSMEFYRWLYTALTRARERIYLINWKNEDDN
ncbi:MAG: AAA family ATPase [Muribaculaceae bacterium]|nr:AAA family ATPase [Muribaculaceae bacterium]